MMDAPLFARQSPPAYQKEVLGAGTAVLSGFAIDAENELLASLHRVVEQSPFRHMVTPGGFRMSVAMTNCGGLGWVTDRSGYRYTQIDPETGRPWPDMPIAFRELAVRAASDAGFPDFNPDSCLINRYEPGAKMSLHQDRNERALEHPIVSVSLGLPATFLFGGPERGDKTQRIRIEHGDVVVWGGPARLFFHGIAPLKDGKHDLVGGVRYNLTFRNAG
jgi:alkylated DNA repair protein (DNA oxidative demethylase)